ncbi:hypothetical protein PQR67_15140 [Paraburkholderia fungorum]|uniref:hypothetical protein n=1 Tax=Paraburkholderia fungorum TaxID=134537 RepID=UPI0038B6B326
MREHLGTQTANERGILGERSKQCAMRQGAPKFIDPSMLHCMMNDAGFPSLSHGSKNGSLTVALAGIWGINVTSFLPLRRYFSLCRDMSQCMARCTSRNTGQVRGPPRFSRRGWFENTLFNVSEEGTS